MDTPLIFITNILQKVFVHYNFIISVLFLSDERKSGVIFSINPFFGTIVENFFWRNAICASFLLDWLSDSLEIAIFAFFRERQAHERQNA